LLIHPFRTSNLNIWQVNDSFTFLGLLVVVGVACAKRNVTQVCQ